MRGTIAIGVAVLSINVSGDQSQPVARKAVAPTPVVTINKRVPKVTPPPARPVFSSNPTAAEITRARVFPEPLVPVGVPSSDENRALAQAINTYVASGGPAESAPFQAFLSAHASSAWRPALLVNLGGLQRAAGYHKRALATWEDAWRATKDEVSAHGRAIADLAISNALNMLASRGDVKSLDVWLERTRGRAMGGPAASKARRARETRAFIAAHPDGVIASGPKALEILLDWQKNSRSMPRDARPPVPAILKDYRARAAGTPLSEVHELAGKVGLAMTMVRREAGAPIVTPSILHLGFNHFSAVLREEDGRFLVRDPALGGEIWMPRDGLEEEVSGYALVMSDAVGNGWRAVAKSEADTIVGHSCPAGIPDPDDCPCAGGAAGMPTYSLHPTQASVLLSDMPLTYSPPRGPGISVQLRYNHREENQPQIFSFANIGTRWSLNWIAYVEEVPFTMFGNGTSLQFSQPEHLAVHVPEGGVERFTYGNADGTYPRHYRSGAVLALVSSNPLMYERRLTDGSKEVYSLADGGTFGMRRIFLTSKVDPHGQALQFTWDSQLRLASVTDALGQVTTLEYENADPLKVTSVTDPFGRVARFTYDASGQLESVTDVINLTSRFLYGESQFIAALQTPYGTTTFREPTITGEYNRAIEATDPLGAVERLQFHWKNAPVPATAPTSEVPPGFENRNSTLNEIMSLHWGKGRNTANVAEAVASRWLIRSMDFWYDPGWTVSVPHTVQRPGEARTWYVYTGTTTRPSHIARRLPDGTVHEMRATYNAQDKVTWSRDPIGREMTYTYAANNIDLVEVKNTTAGRNDVLATYSNYTVGHQPQTMASPAGQTATTTYNSFGQALTVTNPMQETTTYTYDTNGYLQTVAGPVAGATLSYTYDAYGRLRSVTPAGEASVTNDYDALNRPTRTTYPDGTYEEITYDKLDAIRQRDRRGRITQLSYNARRQLLATRDAAGRVIHQQYCACGALDAVIDGNGNVTRWERDAAGRVLREVRGDGVTDIDYSYDALGRLKTVTDPEQQVTTYTYNLDGSVAAVAYTNAQIPTPGVTWTYDPAYPRVATMQDGTGTTTYTYHPAGQLGARQVATVDGPLANDLVSYTYDALGRMATRVIGGVPLTLTYDTLGRVQQEVNALGTFQYGYDGVSGRLSTVTYPNNQTTTYAYFAATQDHRLQTIHHRYPHGGTLSRFDYTYDAVGNIITWRQQADNDAVIWDYGYDSADQLIRAIKRATDPNGSILQRFAYGYDPAGNRLFEQIDEQVTTWTYDRLNRLVTQRAGGVLRVQGSVDEPARVTVEGRPALVEANGVFVGAVPVAPGTTRFTVQATDASGNVTSKQYDVDQLGAPKTFTFDANGNMTSDGMRTFEWDAVNQLAAVDSGVTRTEFSYDGVQRRTGILERELGVTTGTKRFVWCGKSLCEQRDGTTGANPRRFQARGVQQGTEALFYAQDHLASTHDLTDQAGTLRGRYAYDPYGKRLVVANDRETEVGFTGHYTHESSGLTLAPHRGYDPALGRWVSADPLGIAGGLNLYAYTDGAPVTFADPLGLIKVTIREVEIYRVPQKDVPRRGCAATKRGISIDGSCVCKEDGKWYASLSVTYLPEIWLANDVVVIHPGLMLGYTSQDVLLKHELTHHDSNVRIVGEIKSSGEKLEGQAFSDKASCQAGVDKWKQEWTNEIRTRKDDWFVGNFFRGIRCW